MTHASPDILHALRRALAGTYDVERQIGVGGMATVFRAQDLKHSRRVAIKVLRPELAASLGPERFLQEIDIAARLQHPHILPVYDSGDADGILYYVMPYVEGESLRDRLQREGQLAWPAAQSIATEVASALDYAHREGVVHRDIKPANILLSQGHAVVADFGIARAIRGSGSAGMTLAGMAIGTPWYMSPEQASGDAQVDGRTDVYALGCVLYEMLSGAPPFDGPTPQSIIAKLMSTPAPRIQRPPPSTPRTAHDVLARAMAKEPDQRFQSAGEFRSAIEGASGAPVPWRGGRRWIAAAAAAAIIVAAAVGLRRTTVAEAPMAPGADVIAVLPFSSTGATVDYLGEGMVDLLSTNLNGVGGIRTIDSRSVISRWRKSGGEDGLDLDGALAVGRDLHAGAILIGSVVEAGSSVRFSAELHAVEESGNLIGRVQIDGPADSILSLVDTLSLRLLRTAWRSREPLPSVSVSGITTGSLDAIRAYLLGEQFYRAGQWDSAVTHFDAAVAHDSTFALAHAQLALAHGWIEGLGATESSEAVEAAVRFADRLPLRDRSLIVGYQHFIHNEMEAVDSLRAYVERYPSSAVGWQLLGDVQFHAQGVLALSPDRLLEPFDRALAMDPTFSPALVHPLDITFEAQDSARFHRYLALASDDLAQGPGYRLLDDVSWGEPEARAAALPDLLRSPPTAHLLLRSAARRPDAPHGAELAALLDSAARADTTAGAGDVSGRIKPLQARAYGALQHMAMGQIEDAMADARALMAGPSTSTRRTGALIPLHAMLAGYMDADSAATFLAAWEGDSVAEQFRASLEAQIELTRGNPATARRILAAHPPTVVPGSGLPIRMPALYRAVRGWARIEEGDTLAGIQEMQEGIEAYGLIFSGLQSGTGPLRLHMSVAMARYAATRDEGIRRLRHGFDGEPELLGAALLELARTLEHAGDRQAALDAYGDLLDLWRDAGPMLRPRVAAARRAVQRLTAEPAPQ